MNSKSVRITLLAGLLALNGVLALAEEAEQNQKPLTAPIAILPFTAKSASVKDQGSQIADILLMGLEADGRFTMVSREELDKILGELQLSASGLVSKATQNKIGQLTGAKILITGSIFKNGVITYVVAKLIGVETSQIVGCGTSGKSSATELAEELTPKVITALISKSKKLLPEPLKQADLIKDLKKQLGNVSGVKVYVNIKETVINAIDPAVQTELQTILGKVGFTLTEDKNKADYSITGEAFGENGGKIKAFFSGVAKAEIKIYDKNGKLIMVDRQKEVVPALSINIACKDALQQAGMQLAKRIIPQLKK
jgi:TolB-like protein